MIIIQSSYIHPVFIIIFILIYNITLCINIITIKINPLYPIIFFIIIIRGILIIFLYFSRLVSNEKNLNLLYKSIIITISINVIYLTASIYKNNFLMPLINSDTNTSISSTQSSEDDWLNRNKLYLNVSKTKVMLIRGIRRKVAEVKVVGKVKFRGGDLEVVSKIKCLGVMINRNLNFTEHVDYIDRKVRAKLGVLR